MVFPGEDPPFIEETITPSKGRVRTVKMVGRRTQYQDPDLRLVRITKGVRGRPFGNVFITREKGIERLKYNFDKGIIQDSFGASVAAGHLRMPGIGRITDYRTKEVITTRLGIDPRRYRPAANEVIIEENIFIHRDGSLKVVRTSHGFGQKYEPKKYGGRWVRNAKEALGKDPDEKITTSKLKKAVAHRSFLVQKVVPKGQ